MHNLIKKIKFKNRSEKKNIHGAMSRRGFTLIELMVVLSIVAILASFVMSSLQSSRLKAYDSQIISDMTQIRNALELYANDHNYTYPQITNLVSSKNSQIAQVSQLKHSSFVKVAEASGSRDQNCVYFDNLTNLLVPNYLGAIPRHPLDDGSNICYKYFANEGGDTAVAYGPLVTQTYSGGLNKQIGIAVGKTDQVALQNICTANLNSGTGLGTGAMPFPLFSGGSDHCMGIIADAVIGMTSGDGNVTLNSSCSVGDYSTQEGCEADHSYCSDPSYTNQAECEANGHIGPGQCSGGVYSDQSSCEGATYMAGARCQNAPQYTDQSSCESAGYYYGYCSNSGYTDQSSCEGAGYYMGGGCINSSYYDQSSCEGAGYTDNGYCSGGGSYTDESSCVNAGVYPSYCNYGPYSDEISCTSAICGETPAHCSYSWYYDQENCENNGGQWYSSEPINCGYQWSVGSSGYGYTWYPGQFVSYGYTWSSPTFYSYNYYWTSYFQSYNYNWYPGESTSYGYIWTPGQYISNEWVVRERGVWATY